MTDSVRILSEKNEIIQRYFQAPEWTHFDTKTDAVLIRRQEFFAGRVCAALAYKKITTKDLTELAANEDRSPRWPAGIVGSISHNENYVVAELSAKFSGLGIDLATLGSVSQNLHSSVCNSDDITKVSEITDADLLTFIFSFKESLFKAIYPQVKIFFDFQSASVVNIDFAKKTFQISLSEKIATLLLEKRNIFEGDFVFVDQKTLLSRIIIP